MEKVSGREAGEDDGLSPASPKSGGLNQPVPATRGKEELTHSSKKRIVPIQERQMAQSSPNGACRPKVPNENQRAGRLQSRPLLVGKSFLCTLTHNKKSYDTGLEGS